ncbi:cyclic nucleotide-gated cation channel alpha-4-like [Rhincodon typus]|uniref:cyclic nucleotide-gated cation channel alpha-4-like n=1 Tax=Rhincodon typus TaxID=259920 RepID=UPI0009A39752|nr:cyclic nucleotide-gated cation channel alpha-4-like [Rhincodon typus]
MQCGVQQSQQQTVCSKHTARLEDTHISTSEGQTGEDGETGRVRPRWILDPMGDWYIRWLAVSTIPVIYNWIILVGRWSFTDLQSNYLSVWLFLDYLSDLIYLLSMAVRFNTGYLEQGILVTDRWQIAARYARSHGFKLDLLSLVPTDLLYVQFGVHSPAIRLNRLLTVRCLPEFLQRLETRVFYPNTYRVLRTSAILVASIHWNACAYFALSRHIGFGQDPWVYPNISDPDNARLRRQYLYSFYFSTLVLSTIGNIPKPVREEEFLFVMVDFLIAVLVFASIVGNMESIISKLDKAAHSVVPDHQLIRDYLRSQRVNTKLQRRVTEWSQHLRLYKKVTNERHILQLLPDKLQAEVATCVHLQTLRKVQLFQSCEQRVLYQLVMRLQPQVFSPGDYVCRKGDIGRAMYIVQDGCLAVVADDGLRQLAVLEAGNYFGEISILNIAGSKSGNRRTANIRSVGYSDLFALGKDDLTEVLVDFPEAKEMLEAKGQEMLLRMGLLDGVVAPSEAEKGRAVRNVGPLQNSFDLLQTRMARLMAEIESSFQKINFRLDHLEDVLGVDEDPERKRNVEDPRLTQDQIEESRIIPGSRARRDPTKLTPCSSKTELK